MNKDLLMWDETLFRDIEVFDIDYMPEQFDFRDSQIRELAANVRPALGGARPLNTICKGLPGTGKTTTVKMLFSDIEEKTKKILPVYINCQIENTKFAIFAQIYKKLTKHNPPSSGTSFKSLFDQVCRLAAEKDVILLVCLDDANYLIYNDEINNVLYTLLRSHEANEGVKTGVITIISDMSVDLMQSTDQRVASVFRPSEVYFAPYTKDEIAEILNQRVMQGLYPNVITRSVLDVIAEQTMKSGDLRVGIDLLKRSALNAENAARKSVEKDDVCKAYQVSKYLHLSNSVRTLSNDEKLVLRFTSEFILNKQEEAAAKAEEEAKSAAEKEKEAAVLEEAGVKVPKKRGRKPSAKKAETDKNKEKPVTATAGEIFESMKETEKIGYTRFSEIITKLENMRIIDLNYRDGHGRTRIVSLRYDPKRIIDIVPKKQD